MHSLENWLTSRFIIQDTTTWSVCAKTLKTVILQLNLKGVFYEFMVSGIKQLNHQSKIHPKLKSVKISSCHLHMDGQMDNDDESGIPPLTTLAKGIIIHNEYFGKNILPTNPIIELLEIPLTSLQDFQTQHGLHHWYITASIVLLPDIYHPILVT